MPARLNRRTLHRISDSPAAAAERDDDGGVGARRKRTGAVVPGRMLTHRTDSRLLGGLVGRSRALLHRRAPGQTPPPARYTKTSLQRVRRQATTRQ